MHLYVHNVQETSGIAQGSITDTVVGRDPESFSVAHNPREANKACQPEPLQQCTSQQWHITSAANVPLPLHCKSDCNHDVLASSAELDASPRRLARKSEVLDETEDLPVAFPEHLKPHANNTAATGTCTVSLPLVSACNVKATLCEHDGYDDSKSKDRWLHEKLLSRQQKHHSKKIVPPWRPSGSVTRPLTSCSVHLPGNACCPGMTRKTDPPATTTRQAPVSAESAIQMRKATLPHVQSSSQGTTGPSFVPASYSSPSHMHVKTRAHSLPPSWSPGELGPSNVLFTGGHASSCLMQKVRAQSTPCTPTGSMPQQNINKLWRYTAGAAAPTTRPNPGLNPVWSRLAAHECKAARCWNDCWLVAGSRAQFKKEWGKEDFAAARRLGFELQAAVSSDAETANRGGYRKEVKAHRISSAFRNFGAQYYHV